MLFHCKKNRNNIYKSDVKVIFKLYVYAHFRCIWILHPKEQCFYQVLSYSFDLKAPWELGYLLSKEEPGKFHGYGGQSKRICLQDRVNFLRSLLWQIVLIINIAVPFLWFDSGHEGCFIITLLCIVVCWHCPTSYYSLSSSGHVETICTLMIWANWFYDTIKNYFHSPNQIKL